MVLLQRRLPHGGTATGSEPTGGSNGQIPGCTTIASSYYNKTANEVLVGGYNGSFPDPVINGVGYGALRFTNGYPYGYHENGGIVSTVPFPTGQGVSITFKTVTYLGDKGGSGKDGADGISFFLMDASKLNTATITGQASGDGNGLGAWGGSLGYTCSNSNSPYNGLNGGYVGLGIDEYGNFLNGTTNTLGETGTTASGDNTATGGGYQPGRIGLRGAGSINWNALTAAYGSNPSNSAAPYYPASLATSCVNSGGTWNATTGGCMSCGTGTYNSTSNLCITTNCSTGTYNTTTQMCMGCTNGGTYNLATNSCTATSCATGTYNASQGACESCSTGTYDSSLNLCQVCPSGYTYQPSTVNCKKGATTKSLTSSNQPTSSSPTASSLTSTAPNSSSPSSGAPDSIYAVQKTCSSGNLWNYATVSVPTNAGAATLANAYNTAGLLDYPALTGGYSVLSSVTIANETATTRANAMPIYYQLKISQNGLLSLSYATCPANSCGAWQGVLTKSSITASNGPLPANFLFGFAGSTGGSSNIHEILCFRADPATSASSSAGASEKQSAKLETGVQAYFAYYNPSNGYTGRVTASSLGFDQYGNVTINSVPNWDAACVLTGVPAGSTCSTTGVAGLTLPEPPLSPSTTGSRQILTWNDQTLQGVAFQFGNLSPAQQTQLTLGDATSGTPDRVNFLRGDRSNEVNSVGVGEFRRRSGVLADIVDSSPTWVGAPGAPYAATWNDRLYASTAMPENSPTAANYASYMSSAGNRTQVVYVGANDGLLHGFRSGTYNSSSGNCATTPSSSCFTNNDGLEVLAYIPGSTLAGTAAQLIHPDITNVTGPTSPNAANIPLDYSNPQYGHNYFVNATPGAGDLFFGGRWHSWLVGGLGSGGAVIYALDVSDPTQFSESTPQKVVVGEWNKNTISCLNVGSCGNNLGNTYGTPQIRRLHDGRWAVIFGNGLGSTSGDAGIFVMTLDPTSGAANGTYYLSANPPSASKPNGITYVTAADLDGDHVTDYVYAGDVKGNVWRFDLTSSNESNWGVSPGPLFSTGGQPITTQLVVASGSPTPGTPQQLLVMFGTGQKTGFTNATGSSYATGTQTLYGVWDWNLSGTDGGRGGAGAGGGWDSLSTSAQYGALTRAAAGLTTLTPANLVQQIVTVNTTTQNRDINTNATPCWNGGCTWSSARQYGWYLNLPGTQEQVIYSPELVAQAFTVNTILPANNSQISCSSNNDTGFTYVLNALTGGAFNQVFLPPSEQANPAVAAQAAYTDAHAIAMQTNATGSSFITSNASGVQYLVYETNQVQSNGGNGTSNNIQGGTLGLNLPPNTLGRRLSWIELR